MALSKDKLVLLTLNTHSYQEKDNDFCITEFAKAILSEMPDVIALQEVNQQTNGEPADKQALQKSGFVYCDSEIGSSNWAFRLAEYLNKAGAFYYWSWTFAHIGYPGWDEGIAIFSKLLISELSTLDASVPNRADCKISRRKILFMHSEVGCFASVHTGWWGDTVDPFALQWEKLHHYAENLHKPCWLLGDFNCPATIRGEGYDLITLDSAWIDCYTRADVKDTGITVAEQIDGWRDREVDGLRIDFCFANHDRHTLSSKVILNGEYYPVISDHFAVLTVESLKSEK